MTCIVGVAKGGSVWLGGDSAATDGHLNRTIIKDPKVFLRGEVGFGFAGSPKVMDVLAHAIELPIQSDGSDRAFLVGTLVPALRAGLSKLDATVNHEGQVQFPGSVLLGYRGELYQLQSNFQLIRSSSGYASVGSGSQLALGSLAATRSLEPRKRVLAALEVSTGNAGCAPPFNVIVVKKPGFWR